MKLPHIDKPFGKKPPATTEEVVTVDEHGNQEETTQPAVQSEGKKKSKWATRKEAKAAAAKAEAEAKAAAERAEAEASRKKLIVSVAFFVAIIAFAIVMAVTHPDESGGTTNQPEATSSEQSEEDTVDITFANIEWTIDTWETEVGTLLPRVTVSASVVNKTGRDLYGDDCPAFYVGPNKYPFADSLRERGGATEEIEVTLYDTNPKKFAFRCPNEEIALGGIEGVAEEIEKAYAEKLESLPAEQKALDDQKAAEAEERKQKAEAEQKARDERAAELEAAAEEKYRASTCWVTPTGTQYHKLRGCQYIQDESTLTEMTVGEAQGLGYEPCDRCGYRENGT